MTTNSPAIKQLPGPAAGYFRVFVWGNGVPRTEITVVRDAPIQVSSMSWNDPFGPATAALMLPQITSFDAPGEGDLFWLRPWVNVDIVYCNEYGAPTGFQWEGAIVSEDPSAEGLSLSCKGALYLWDNYLAKPTYPSYAIPYELIMKQQLDPATAPQIPCTPLRVEFPSGWATTVPSNTNPSYLWFLRPWGVTPGQLWTGLTTRNTGAWEPRLTGFIQNLLSVMYTDCGQWTIDLHTGRAPVLRVRNMQRLPDEKSFHVWNNAPGVGVSLSRDFTQTTNVVYGNGTDLQGSAFSNQTVSADGQTTTFTPFSALPSVEPASRTNPRYMAGAVIRKESRLSFPNGIDPVQAAEISTNQIQRFADPGYTGTVTLTADPLLGGNPVSKFTIAAGSTIVIHQWRGGDLLAHISSVNADIANNSVELTVDTKFRDALTVAEVNARTRDALDPLHLLQVGQFSTTVQDQILPWSYSSGSGVIPSAGTLDATEFFTKKMDPSATFPWTDWTKKYPPRKYPQFYIKLNPANTNADKNWSGTNRSGLTSVAIPVRMAQAGQIRLTQIAAYDIDGNVLPVNFHVGFYNNSGVSYRDMPRIPSATTPGIGKYRAGQHYPFYKGAFEQINEDGTESNNPGQLLANGADMIVAWGNYYERVGYYPGHPSHNGPTGMMVDETAWSFDTTGNPDFNKYDVAATRKNKTAGLVYCMIYCDTQGTKPVYFLGKLSVQPQGST